MSDEYPAWTRVETALELRALAQERMRDMGSLAAGMPETGPVHRSVMLDTAAHRPVKADIVEPAAPGPNPVMVFIHGGGWVMGDLDTHHQVVLRFAEQGFIVVAIEYGLAPEEPFPAGYDDAVAAIGWTVENIARYGGDPDRVVVAGDSAGANIAAGIAVSRRDLPIRALALVYGVYDFEHMPTSPEIQGDGFLADLHKAYLGPEGLHLLRDPRVSPIHAATDLPPAIIMVGSLDPLASESRALADQLATAGVEHQLVVLPGYHHAFLHFETMPETLPAFRTIASFLQRQLGSPEAAQA